MSREIRRFDVSFKDPNAVFKAGELVQGTVAIDLASEVKLKGVKFALQGVGRVSWDESKSFTKGTSTNLSHKNMEVFLDEVMIMHRAEGGSLKAGNYNYPFTIRLPPFLPASFDGQYGKVMYWAKAYLDRPWKGDTEIRKNFTVKSMLDLNTEAVSKKSADTMGECMLGALCCKTGPIIARLSLGKRGYVPGENIPFKAALQNKSKKLLESVRITLSQQVTYRADTKMKKTTTVVKGLAIGDVEGNEKCEWEDELKNIPPVPPTRLGGGGAKMIEVKYFISIGSANSKLDTPIEITIGTIPLRKTDQGTPQLTVKAAMQHIKETGSMLDPSKLVKGQRISPRPSPVQPRAQIRKAPIARVQ